MKSKKPLPYEDEVVKKKYKDDQGRVVYENSCALCGEVVTYVHGDKPEICPYCNQEDFIKPVTETRLFFLQNKYLETRNTEILGSMYLLMRNYARSLIKKVLPREFTYHYDKVNEKASDAANTIIDYYLSNDYFQIEKSFAGYINTKVREVLWNKKDQNEENHESIYQYIADDVDKEIVETTEILNLEPIFSQYHEYLDDEHIENEILEGLDNIIQSISNRILEEYGLYFQIITLFGVYYYVANQGRMSKFYECFPEEQLKELIDKSMVIVYEFIKEH